VRREVAVVPVDLARWDHARPGDLLAVPVFTDVRPLRGAAGLLDWRMCGRLSGFVTAGKLSGAEGEQLLFPSASRLPWRFVLAAGAGTFADFSDKRLRALVKRTVATVRGLKVSRVALALPLREPRPGESMGGAESPASLWARRALDLAMAEIEAQPGTVGELTIITPPALQKDLTEALRLRAVRS
jgi:hypothetical protein